MDRHFAWQAWHLVTWTVTLRGRRGTFSHGLSLCVAGVARTGLGDATFACGSEDLEVPCEVTLCMFSCLTFSKQLEINIVHGMWSYSLIEVRHCRLFATVAFSRAARVQQNWKLAESSRSSSRRGHISFLCFIDTLSDIPCNHGHSPSGSVTSGR